MSQLGDSYMLNSDLSPPNHKHSRRSRKQQQIGAKSPSLLPQGGRPAYQQAVQKASRLLGMPLALISLFGEEERIAAAVGLEFLGESPSIQALGIQGCSQFLERSHQCLASADVLQDDVYFDRAQVKIAAYLGVSLWTRGGDCVGTLAVMDRQVREFTEQDRATLHLVADWLMCELEREILFKAQVAGFFELPTNNPVVEKSISMEAEAKFNLLSHLSQSLRTPLTAVLGMTGVLQRELYGPLNEKQHSYMSVVHHSGQQLAALVDEIANLGALEQIDSRLTLKAADVEMLCQQSIRDLDGALKQRRQHVEVAIELTNRIWLLDRDKVRQILYYLLLHTLYCLPPEAVIGMIVSATGDRLAIEIQGLPPRSTGTNLRILPLPQQAATANVDVTHTQLGLVLSHVLTETHEGSLEQIGTYGHRLLLPLITSDLEEIISHDS
jgi:signal transduction histidine kinase